MKGLVPIICLANGRSFLFCLPVWGNWIRFVFTQKAQLWLRMEVWAKITHMKLHAHRLSEGNSPNFLLMPSIETGTFSMVGSWCLLRVFVFCLQILQNSFKCFFKNSKSQALVSECWQNDLFWYWNICKKKTYLNFNCEVHIFAANAIFSMCPAKFWFWEERFADLL